jgi:hypothetical protein
VCADVAQLVEQLIRNQQVIGSSPIVGSIPPFSNHKSPYTLDTVAPSTGQSSGAGFSAAKWLEESPEERMIHR